MESSDEDSGIELGPSKAEVQKQLKKMKFEKLKREKKMANQEKKIHTPEEKRQFNKKQIVETMRRSAEVEKVIQNIGVKAGVPTIPVLDEMAPVQGKIVGKQGGFDVSLNPKKKFVTDNLFVNAGFSVEWSKPGKKRKGDSKLPVGPEKKKNNSFVVSTSSEGATKNVELKSKPLAEVIGNKKMKKIKSKQSNETMNDVPASNEAYIVGEIENEPQAKATKVRKIRKKSNKISKKLNEMQGGEALAPTKEATKALKPIAEKIENKKNFEKKLETKPMEIERTKELIEKAESSEALSQAVQKPQTQPMKGQKFKELNSEVREKLNENSASTEGLSQGIGEEKIVDVKTKLQAQAIRSKKTNTLKFVVSESPVRKKDASSPAVEAKMETLTKSMKSMDAREVKAKKDTSIGAQLCNGTHVKSDLNKSLGCEQEDSKKTSVSTGAWADPLKEGEYEIIIKSRKTISREKKNPLKARNTKVK